jgi:hypothetical protein
MCVKIKSINSEAKYNPRVPLELQVSDCDKIVIKYEAKDPDIDKFIGEMERCCKTGINLNIDVDVAHQNDIKGAKAKKQVKRLLKDLNLNEAIKLLVMAHSKTDRKLEEMANFCLRKDNVE